MRAVWYDRQGPANEVIVQGELPTPEPGTGEVRVRLEASGVNPSDWKSRGARIRLLSSSRLNVAWIASPESAG